MKTPTKTKPYHGRDYLKVKLIQGATKAGVEVDRRKQANKDSCRVRVSYCEHDYD